MAALFRRERSPFWWLTWTVEGVKKRESTGVRHDGRRTPPESAKEILRNLEDRLARQRFGLELPPQRVTVAKFVESYTATMSGRESSIVTKTGALNRFSEWCIEEGITSMTEVSRTAACDFVASRLASGVKPVTVKYQNITLAMMMDEAKRRNHIKFEENPFRIRIKVEEVEKEPFTPDQIRSMFTMKAPQWIHTAMRICLSTGARIGSVLSLRWENIDTTAGSMLFTVSKKGQYTVPMSDELVSYLKLIRCDVGELFPEVRGRSQGYAALLFSRTVKSTCKFQANWHRFRHTWVTAMQTEGVPMRVAMTLADHTSEDIHAGYAHTRAVELRSHIKGVSLFPECVQSVS